MRKGHSYNLDNKNTIFPSDRTTAGNSDDRLYCTNGDKAKTITLQRMGLVRFFSLWKQNNVPASYVRYDHIRGYEGKSCVPSITNECEFITRQIWETPPSKDASRSRLFLYLFTDREGGRIREPKKKKSLGVLTPQFRLLASRGYSCQLGNLHEASTPGLL